MENKREVREITLPDIKTQYIGIRIKAVLVLRERQTHKP